jgi:DNA-binding NarL/FixJ family response regulator
MIRTLVVDDHRGVRLGFAAYLEADGFDVIGLGENGHEAVALCREHRPDVVLMDVRMPELDGIEATRQITSEWPATRVVLVSAYEAPGLVEAGHEAGAAAFVHKGISGANLAALLRTVAA